MIVWGYQEPEPAPEVTVLTQNVSGGMDGPQPYPKNYGSDIGTSTEFCGTVDVMQEFLCETNEAPNVIRSYSETLDQAWAGPTDDNGVHQGSGAPLPDQTLGISRNGYRGMTDEPLPVRPPSPDCDDDYDNDAECE